MTKKATKIFDNFKELSYEFYRESLLTDKDFEEFDTLLFREWSKTETMICQMWKLSLLSWEDRTKLIELIAEEYNFLKDNYENELETFREEGFLNE